MLESRKPTPCPGALRVVECGVLKQVDWHVGEVFFPSPTRKRVVLRMSDHIHLFAARELSVPRSAFLYDPCIRNAHATMAATKTAESEICVWGEMEMQVVL